MIRGLVGPSAAATAVALLSFAAPARAEPPAASPTPDAPPTAAAAPSSQGLALAQAGILAHPLEYDDTWDLNLEGAYGKVLCDGCGKTGFGRARVGFLGIRDRYYVMAGLTYDIGDRSPAVVGLQGELVSKELGVWVQLGGQLDLAHLGGRSSGPGFMASVGWSLFGFEMQRRSFDEDHAPAWAAYGKIRIPVRLVLRAIRGK